MPAHSERQRRFFQAVKGAKHNPNAPSNLRKVANSMSEKDIDDFIKCESDLKIKKAILSVLKDCREPMYLNEEDEDQSGIDPVANTFHVKEEWSKYIKPFIGQPLSQKEQESLSNFKDKQPTTVARTEIWYKTTDTFGGGKTSVIRKMKDSGQFSFIAFQKIEKKPEPEKPEDEMGGMNAGQPLNIDGNVGGPDLDQPPNPEGNSVPGSPTPPIQTPSPEQKPETEEKDDIIVTKSLLFKDDIKGAAILVEFLKKLDL